MCLPSAIDPELADEADDEANDCAGRHFVDDRDEMMARHLDEMARRRPHQQSHFSWMSPAELGSAAQPDEQGLPIARTLSEPLEALPGGDHAVTPELARAAGAEPTQPTSGTERPVDDVSREKRYQASPSGGKMRLLCNFVRRGKQCCDKQAHSGRLCIKHGGGKRCSQEGCKVSAAGGSGLCIKHGGGPCCAAAAAENGCPRSAQGGSKLCKAHMPRCQAVCADEPGAAPASCLHAGWLDELSGFKLCRSHKELGLVNSAQARQFLEPMRLDSLSVQQLVADLFSGCPGGELSLHSDLGAKLCSLLSATDLANVEAACKAELARRRMEQQSSDPH